MVDLLNDHRDEQGWFTCAECGGLCFIERSYRIAEGENWDVCLWGALRLQDDPEQTYQPYAFFLTDNFSDDLKVWFRYYKDLRPNGKLLTRLGKGPVIDAQKVVGLGRRLNQMPEGRRVRRLHRRPPTP